MRTNPRGNPIKTTDTTKTWYRVTVEIDHDAWAVHYGIEPEEVREDEEERNCRSGSSMRHHATAGTPPRGLSSALPSDLRLLLLLVAIVEATPWHSTISS